MTRFPRRSLSLAALLLITALSAGAARIPQADRAYLEEVYADTWRCLDYFVSPQTGLPYDSHERRPSTSISNIGLYLAATAVAGKTGLIPPGEAVARLRKGLSSLARIPKWRGFPVSWVNADTLEVTENNFSTVDHLGNLTAGLLVVKGLYPEFKDPIEAQIDMMNWDILYDPANHYYRGGYNLKKQDFDAQQRWGDWYYTHIGADTRFASFFGVASGKVPPAHWTALNRETEERHGLSYFVPGWQGGGLFMQFMSGLFLDERYTLLGKSAASFAYAQIVHAAKIGAPVWGWSAATDPTGGAYLGWGNIRDEIVTPHASALAVSYYPQRVAANLRLLDEKGARENFREGNADYAFGFRDSMNWQTGLVSGGYLSLNQGMLFLSLANFLHDGVVWKAVAADPVVKRGLATLPEYAERDPKAKKIYDRRDRSVLSPDFP